MKAPNGIQEIYDTFGDIRLFINDANQLSNTWNSKYLSVARLPYPLGLAWNLNTSVQKITCHKLMVPVFEAVFSEIVTQGLQSSVTTLGGCFSFRPQRMGIKLSTHCWGIAIDLNPGNNEQGTFGNMDTGIITIFRNAGFKWGGDWSGKSQDPMHFQFATGY